MRIHLSKKKEGHEQHCPELLLYTADDENKWTEKYYENIHEIETNKKTIYLGEGTKILMETLDLEKDKPEHMFDILDSQR